MLKKIILITLVFLTMSELSAQRVGFISSDMIRSKFPEAQMAEQRIQSMVEDWKRELEIMQENIDNLEFEIKKNRLIWTDKELNEKEKELQTRRQERESFAKRRFGPDGEYDKLVEQIMKPIEEKIYAAVHQVAVDEGFDLLLDQSIQPIPYANYKYDMTLKVLKKLGVDVKELEAQLEEKVQEDPRNEMKKSKKPRRRGRGRNDPNEREEDLRQFEREEEQKEEQMEEEFEEFTPETPEEEQEEEKSSDPRRRLPEDGLIIIN